MDYWEDLARSCEHLNYLAHLSSSNLSKQFRLTTLPAQSIERLVQAGKKMDFHNFMPDLHINPDKLLNQRNLRKWYHSDYMYLFFYLLQFLREYGQLGVLGRVATKIVSSTEDELAMLTHSLWKQSVLEMNETWHHAQEISATVSKNLYFLICRQIILRTHIF